MEFLGTIEKGGLLFPAAILEQRRLFLQSIKDDTPIAEKIWKTWSPKTDKQLKTIFGHMMTQTILQANELGIDSSGLLAFLMNGSIPKGAPITKDLLHQLIYLVCPTVDEEGRRITLSKMNTEQASRLFETFRTVMAPLGIVIADPDPNWREGIWELTKLKEKKAGRTVKDGE